MRFFYNNLIDATGVAITTSSQQTNLPAANVTHEHKAKVWRTGTSVATEYIVFDLGSAQEITSCIIFNHTLLNTDSDIKIQGNASDSWGAPSVDETLTWGSGPIFKTFTGGTYRYWRFVFTKASSGVTRDVGRIFLGDYYTSERQPDYNGLDQNREDMTVTARAIGGQTWSWDRPQYRPIEVAWTSINDTDASTFETIKETVGEHTPFFVIVDEAAATSHVTGEVFYVKLRSLGGRDVHSYDGSEYFWSTKMTLEEQL